MTLTVNKGRHSVSSLRIQLVCVTKQHQFVFSDQSLPIIRKSFNDVAEKMGFKVIEFNGGGDYVRVLIEYPIELSISKMVNSLKSVSSRRYSQAGYEKPDSQNALWSPKYYVASAEGLSLYDLMQFVIKQEKPS